MATLDLRQSVLDYVRSADDRFLRLVKAMAENYQDDEERISIAQYNRELEASEKQIENGDFYIQEQVRQKIDEWAKE